MAKVKELKKQEITYIFHDDYCVTDPEEVNFILEKIAEEVLPKIRETRQREKRS